MDLNSIFPVDISDKEKSEIYGDLNKQIADVMFDIFKSLNYQAYDIEYLDTYFIFQGNPNSVIHFKLKGLWKRWKFGMWVRSDYLFLDDSDKFPCISIFCQHENTIDKFKPSRSDICVEIKCKEFKEWLNGGWSSAINFKIKETLNWVKLHPFLSFVGSVPSDYSVYPDNVSKSNSVIRCFKSYYREDLERYRETIKLPILTIYASEKIKRFKKYDIVKDAFIRSFGSGWVVNPRITVEVEFKEDASLDDIEKLVFKLLPHKQFDDIGKINSYTYILRFSFSQGDYSITFD